MKSNITLVGMPASGKSTIGVLLAKRLGYSFVDVDIVIQEKTGQLLKSAVANPVVVIMVATWKEESFRFARSPPAIRVRSSVIKMVITA